MAIKIPRPQHSRWTGANQDAYQGQTIRSASKSLLDIDTTTGVKPSMSQEAPCHGPRAQLTGSRENTPGCQSSLQKEDTRESVILSQRSIPPTRIVPTLSKSKNQNEICTKGTPTQLLSQFSLTLHGYPMIPKLPKTCPASARPHLL
jgi:hypothetical protein